MSKVTIKFEGAQGAGKTLLSKLIKGHLDEHAGNLSVVSDVNSDSDNIEVTVNNIEYLVQAKDPCAELLDVLADVQESTQLQELALRRMKRSIYSVLGPRGSL